MIGGTRSLSGIIEQEGKNKMKTDRIKMEDEKDLQIMKNFLTAVVVIESAMGALLAVSNIVMAIAVAKISLLLQLSY